MLSSAILKIVLEREGLCYADEIYRRKTEYLFERDTHSVVSHKQEQLSEIDGKLQLVLEQLAVMNQNRFGRKTEQMPVPEQLAFTDVDGELVLFNEAEVLDALD